MTQKNRGLKHRVLFSNAIEKIYDSFKGYSEKTKIPMSKMLDEAIEDYLKNMRLNINFFISFLDKNSSTKLKT